MAEEKSPGAASTTNAPAKAPRKTAVTKKRAARTAAPAMSAEDRALQKKSKEFGAARILKIVSKAEQESALKPFQAELILLQKYLEETKRRMIILFEGRDILGLKGGMMRRWQRDGCGPPLLSVNLSPQRQRWHADHLDVATRALGVQRGDELTLLFEP